MTNSMTTINQLEKAIDKIKPISITNIYFHDSYNRNHVNLIKMWKSETESIDYRFETQDDVTQEDIEYRVALTNATPLELLTALF
jgi:pantothenate kinase